MNKEIINSSNIIVFTLERFPDGDATSNRLRALLKTIENCNYKVFVVGNGDPIPDNYVWQKLPGSNIDYTSIRSSSNNKISRIFRRLLSTSILLNACVNLDKNKVAALVTTHTTISIGVIFIAKFLWKVPLIVECSEWHERKQFNGPLSHINYLNFWFKFNILCPLAKNIICITDALGDKFKNNCNTIVIPPTFIPADFSYNPEINLPNDKVNIFYGGNISNKDDIATVIKGMLLLRESERKKIIFTIAGPSVQDLKNYLLKSDINASKALELVRPIGRISKDQILNQLKSTDFTILLRPISQYSIYGFPSKIVESLAAGVPPILNITSDLGKYLEDKKQCIIVNDCAEDAVAESLRKVLSLSKDEIKLLKINARKTALKEFNCTSHLNQMKNFLMYAK